MKILMTLLVFVMLVGCKNEEPEVAEPTVNTFVNLEGVHELHTKAKADIHECHLAFTAQSTPVTVYIKGEKKLDGVWVWRSAEWPAIWVRAVVYGNQVKVGCNPELGSAVNQEMLHHAYGHSELLPKGILNHPQQYDAKFNWSGLDRVGGRSITSISGHDLKGTPYHVDLAKPENPFKGGNGIKLRTAPWGDVKSIVESGELWED
jgi:hypothetical protein